MPTGVYLRSEEQRMRLSKSNIGRARSESAKEKLSKAKKGKPSGREGTRHTESAKQKISQAVKKNWDILSIKEREDKLFAAHSTTSSSIEKIVCNLLDMLSIEYMTQVPLCSCHFFVDIFIPSKNTVIECNGDYWHNLDYRKMRDKALQEFCDDEGIKLMWLWEHDIRVDAYTALKLEAERIKNNVVRNAQAFPV